MAGVGIDVGVFEEYIDVVVVVVLGLAGGLTSYDAFIQFIGILCRAGVIGRPLLRLIIVAISIVVAIPTASSIETFSLFLVLKHLCLPHQLGPPLQHLPLPLAQLRFLLLALRRRQARLGLSFRGSRSIVDLLLLLDVHQFPWSGRRYVPHDNRRTQEGRQGADDHFLPFPSVRRRQRLLPLPLAGQEAAFLLGHLQLQPFAAEGSRPLLLLLPPLLLRHCDVIIAVAAAAGGTRGSSAVGTLDGSRRSSIPCLLRHLLLLLPPLLPPMPHLRRPPVQSPGNLLQISRSTVAVFKLQQLGESPDGLVVRVAAVDHSVRAAYAADRGELDRDLLPGIEQELHLGLLLFWLLLLLLLLLRRLLRLLGRTATAGEGKIDAESLPGQRRAPRRAVGGVRVDHPISRREVPVPVHAHAAAGGCRCGSSGGSSWCGRFYSGVIVIGALSGLDLVCPVAPCFFGHGPMSGGPDRSTWHSSII